MSGPGVVRFELPPLASPSHLPNFVFDLATSDDGSSEKERDSPLEEKEPRNWSQRPKSMPWTSRPQALRDRLKIRWWREVIIDCFSILMPLPFMFLSAVLIFVNGREPSNFGLSVLDTAIKGVQHTV